jgi:hypothetical protein
MGRPFKDGVSQKTCQDIYFSSFAEKDRKQEIYFSISVFVYRETIVFDINLMFIVSVW